LVPRENPAVNKFWMCDEGRFEYKPVHDSRVMLPMVAGKRARLDAAIAEAARLLREACAGNAASVGVVLSYGATNEDVHALLRLAIDGLQLQRFYAGGRSPGASDDILISADKNPNTAGVERMAPSPLRTLKDLSSDVAKGAVSTILVLGNESVALPAATPVEVIVLASHKGPLVALAQVVLPLATWAEVDGTFTNKDGRVQRLQAALSPAGESLPGWQLASMLAEKLMIAARYASADEVFTEAAGKHGFMRGAEWGARTSPVLLRFGASRG
jgi:NADH-quinone oxidoreductase subunit G